MSGIPGRATRGPVWPPFRGGKARACSGARRLKVLLDLHVDAGRNDRDAHPPGEVVVDGAAEDDVRILGHFLTDAVRSLVHFEQSHVVAAGDVDQQAAGAGHAGVLEQRVADGGFGGAYGAVLALGLAGAHHGLAHFGHYRADVGEIEVDEAGCDHQVGDAADAHVQHMVGHLEGFAPAGALVCEPEQVLIRDDNQRVDELLQLGDAGLGGFRAPAAFKGKWLCHDTNGEHAALARHAGDHRGRTGSRAAAHASGDKHHVHAFEMMRQFVGGLFGGGTPDIWLGTGAEALRQMRAELNAAIRAAVHELLRIVLATTKSTPCSGDAMSGHTISDKAETSRDRIRREHLIATYLDWALS